MEIKSRKKKLAQKNGPPKEQPRSEFLEWNYEKEIFAFGMRLKERFSHTILQQAFVDRSYIVQEEMKQRAVGVEDPVLNLQDNSNLAKKGEELLTEFIIPYLNLSLPKFPRDGVKGIYKHLTSEAVLAKISQNLGTKDLILSSEYPPTQKYYANTFKAIIGALFESSGEARAYEFIRDFVCVQLNQVDINEFWKIENASGLLNEICEDKKIGKPEPRLIGELGKNTLLAAFSVGIYCNKKCIGSGFGESIEIAKEEAIKDSLRNFFQTNANMKPFDYNMPVHKVMQSLSKPAIAAASNDN
jgi:large subunit ribosomal protein L44